MIYLAIYAVIGIICGILYVFFGSCYENSYFFGTNEELDDEMYAVVIIFWPLFLVLCMGLVAEYVGKKIRSKKSEEEKKLESIFKRAYALQQEEEKDEKEIIASTLKESGIKEKFIKQAMQEAGIV